MKMMDTKKAAVRPGSSDGVRINRTGRRTYTTAYKLDLVRRCSEPGVSVAAVAMARRINANLVRRWIVRYERAQLNGRPEPDLALLPVTIEASTPGGGGRTDDQSSVSTRRNRSAASSIEIELRGARIHLRGAVDASALTTVIDVLSRR